MKDFISPDQQNLSSSGKQWWSIERLQLYACLLSHVLACLSLVLVSIWVYQLGGLTWSGVVRVEEFNLHPLLMVTAYAFFTVAALSFQYYDSCFANRKIRKLIHACSITVTVCCAAIALVAVFRSHNLKPKSNFVTLHAWVATSLILCFIMQWSVGFYSFSGFFNGTRLAPSDSFKKIAVAIHKYMGPWLYQGAALTLMLGLEHKDGFLVCSYPIPEGESWVPFKDFHLIPPACRVGHFLGLTVLAMAFSTVFALQDLEKKLSSITVPSNPRYENVESYGATTEGSSLI